MRERQRERRKEEEEKGWSNDIHIFLGYGSGHKSIRKGRVEIHAKGMTSYSSSSFLSNLRESTITHSKRS